MKQFEELTAASDSSPEDSQSSDDSFDWKLYRKTTNIIESLKKRLGKDRKEDRSSSPPLSCQQKGSKSPDVILEELVPQKKALSPEAQKSLSMERNNIFKVIPAHATLACMFDSIAAPSNVPYYNKNHGSSSTLNATSQRHETVIYRKALSDSGISSNELTASKTLETKTKSDTLCKPDDVFKSHPYVPSKPTASGTPRRVLKKSLTEPSPRLSDAKDVFNFFAYGMPNEDDKFDIQAALQSPSFQKPFRQRAMAVRLKEDERPRSSSAPTESPCSPFSDTDR